MVKKFFLFFSFLILTVISTVSCTRKGGRSSTLSLQTPLQTQSISLPAGRKACYGVSVRGTGIADSAASTCSPLTGVISGFVEAGQILQVQVDKGVNRTIDVYLFLETSVANDPCPTMTSIFASTQLSQIYFMGSTTNVTIDQDVQTVNVPTTFPGEAQNIAAQNSYPPACIPPKPAANSAGFHIYSASQLSSNGTIKLLGRVGAITDNKTLTGGTIQLKVQ